MSVPLKTSDPCYWMLEQGRADPSKQSIPTAYDEDCFICRDPEFALMGLPVCYPCSKCQHHIAADDPRCAGCGYDNSDDYQETE